MAASSLCLHVKPSVLSVIIQYKKEKKNEKVYRNDFWKEPTLYDSGDSGKN